jgi:hypothetical protein
MKNWLAKLRISMTLDSDTPQSNQGRIAGADLGRYEAALQSLDYRLKTAPVSDTVPAGLHSATMGALRSATQQEELSVWRQLLWLPAPALAVVILVGVLWATRQPPVKTNLAVRQPQSLAAATVALDQGTELTQKAPALALAPLSTELELLNRDLEKAINFVVASLP